jgi:hypothetical protein
MSATICSQNQLENKMNGRDQNAEPTLCQPQRTVNLGRFFSKPVKLFVSADFVATCWTSCLI